jgi:hypothetical protein
MSTAKRFRQSVKARRTGPGPVVYGVLVGPNKGLTEFVKNAPSDFTQRGKLNGLDPID